MRTPNQAHMIVVRIIQPEHFPALDMFSVPRLRVRRVRKDTEKTHDGFMCFLDRQTRFLPKGAAKHQTSQGREIASSLWANKIMQNDSPHSTKFLCVRSTVVSFPFSSKASSDLFQGTGTYTFRAL